MKEIKIEGFTSDLTPDDRPCISVFGPEGSGKTRLAATAEDPIGLLALDKKSKRTFEQIAAKLGKKVVVNSEDFLNVKDLTKLSMLDSAVEAQAREIKAYYTAAVQKVFERAAQLAEHAGIKSIVLDTASQLWDWILFSHFGRRNQIETFQRGAPNQDMIDFINACKCKNLILIHRATDEWKATGEVDKNGKPKQAPSGKMKSDGFTKIGYFVTAVVELKLKPTAGDADEKFQIKLVNCQTNQLICGQSLEEYGLVGDGICWDRLLLAMGIIE